MKSKWIPILTLCIIFCLTVGCKPKQERQEVETTVPETAVSETTAPIQTNPVTEQELLDLFNGYAYADPANRTVIDCVVMEESQYGILGVVQYTTEDYEGCWFDFLTTGVPLTAGIEALPIGEKNLAFQEADTVTCQLETNGEVCTFTLTFYRNDLETGFKLSSDSQ